MMSLFSIISLLLLFFSLSSAVNNKSYQRLPLPKTRKEGKTFFDIRFGPQTFAFDSTGKGFYTGVSGGKILKYTPETGFVDFAYVTEHSAEMICGGRSGVAFLSCGRPMGIAFNEKTGDLYIADHRLGIHVVSPAGGMAVYINVTADGKPFRFNGLDVDRTTGVVYFTSWGSNIRHEMTGNLYKYDPSTKVGTLITDGLRTTAGCAVSSDGSFVLVSQFTDKNIKRYWIKGPKAGSFEDFTNSIIGPDNIRRIGSSENFWIASVATSSAVKVNANGEVLQTILLKDRISHNVITEVNEFDGYLYIGTEDSRYVRILKL